MKKRSRKKARLETLLNAVVTPVFLVDAKRRVVFLNAGCETLTGWSADEVVGQICEYAGETDPQEVASLTGSLCPPPEVLSGRERSLPTYLPDRRGRTVSRLIHFFPLQDDQDRVEHVLGVITPIRQPAQTTAASPAQQLHAELTALRLSLRHRYGVNSVIAGSEAMRRVLEQIDLARAGASSVLLCGEPGTGKEHIARVIHYASRGGNRAFVPLDCRNLPARELKRTLNSLLQPEAGEMPAFGGLQPGTLYLADVDHLPRDLQQQLLDARKDGETSAPDLRLMASCTGNLQQAVDDEHLLPDLYYLLTTLVIETLPLRQRPEDLPLLAQHLLEALNHGRERQVGGFDERVWEQFREYHWPGNADELAAVVEEAREACAGDLIAPADLPFRFRTGLDAQAVGPADAPEPMPLEPYLEQVERERIRHALEQARHNKSRAAELLQIPRAKLYRRMQALGLEEQEGAE